MTISPNQSAFDRLAPPLQRCLWERGWTGLRPAQCEALPLVLDGQQDMVIAAATASGKTEAVFLPLLTRLWQNGGRGIVLYVAPMKALINDQNERLGLLCQGLDIPVYPWHGDVGQPLRRRFFADPNGLVLITPESLESLLFRKGGELSGVFQSLIAVVVDELHVFIGNERGRQLQSLLDRLQGRIGRRVQRLGLSATLGDMGLAAAFLRPGEADSVRIVISPADPKTLRLKLKAVIESATASVVIERAHTAIAGELFARLRNGNYLIFPNRTGMVEFYADALRQLCEEAGQPITFFPHHGRLGKGARDLAEVSLKRGVLPVSAICTTTLEVGIDIGAIRGVVQIEAPGSVASLCQRIGRAGRREGEAADLWQYCVISENPSATDCVEGLYPDLVQAIAVIRLFLAKWYEPPVEGALHYSTLVQQILSLIGERHGVTAAEAYKTLCLRGPFRQVREEDFIELLRGLAGHDLIMQDASRLLHHGGLGERRVNHFTFFAAFPETEEYRLRHEGKELGTLPLSPHQKEGESLIFAGKRWRIVEIDHHKRRVELVPSSTGRIPAVGGGGIPIHDRVREKMRTLLAGNDSPAWLNTTASEALKCAQRNFQALGLVKNRIVQEGRTVSLFVWQGDRTQDSLVALLRAKGVVAENYGVCLQMQKITPDHLLTVLAAIGSKPCPKPAEILDRRTLGSPEKWDWAVPDRLFLESYASSRLDLAAAHRLCMTFNDPQAYPVDNEFRIRD